MKMLVIGAGGIGSYLIKHLCECIKQEQIYPNVQISVADGDIVELKQIKYQNFKVEDIGKNKAEALAERYQPFGITAIKKRITNEKDLEGYDFYVLCVDNDTTRAKVVKYCHDKFKTFIDLRATGRRMFAMPMLSLKDNMKFIEENDTKEYSCQDGADLLKGWINRGNRIIAEIGCQMVLNELRSYQNRVISLIV